MPETKYKTTFQYKHTPNKWELRPQDPLLAMRKSEKGAFLKKSFAPDFKIYIFGIVLQFLKDWLKQNFWSYLTGLQDPCELFLVRR